MLQANCHIEWNPCFSPKHHQLVLQAKGWKKRQLPSNNPVNQLQGYSDLFYTRIREDVPFSGHMSQCLLSVTTDGQHGNCELMDAHIGFGELEPPKTSSKFFPNFQDCKETGEDYYQNSNHSRLNNSFRKLSESWNTSWASKFKKAAFLDIYSLCNVKKYK